MTIETKLNQSDIRIKLTEKVKNSDTFLGSKKFLLQKIEQYKNNDGKIDTSEVNKIKYLLKNYNNLEDKYEKYKIYIGKNYTQKNKIDQNKLLTEVKNNLEKIELRIGDTEINNKINSYINTKNNEFIKKINKLRKKVPTIKNKQERKEDTQYKKYTDRLDKIGLSDQTQKIIIKGIYEKLRNKIVVIDGKKIKLTSKYIEKNKEKFIKNITKFLIVLMNIESYGGKNIENKKSSAKGPLQWIDGWKNGKKHFTFNRNKGKTSPFETALRRASMFYTGDKYPKFKSDLIPKDIITAWNNGGKLEVKTFNTEKQIQLWYIDLLMRKGKAKDYLIGTMLGNKWSAIKLYTNIHHTNSGKGTKTSIVVKNNFKHLALL